jgi:ATP-dependent RNA helicase DDX24/MAK5
VLRHGGDKDSSGFVELHKILDAVQRANPDLLYDDQLDEVDDDESTSERLRGLPGFPGEAHVEMMPKSLELLQPQQPLDLDDENEDVLPSRDDDENDDADAEEEEDIYVGFDDEENDQYSNDESLVAERPRVQRQTFVFSATLTLPSSSGQSVKTTDRSKKRKRNESSGGGLQKGLAWENMDGAIAEILQKSRAVGPTKVVDLTTSADSLATHGRDTNESARAKKTKDSTQRFQLPPGLQLQQIKCTQLHKDSHLYAYLKTTASGTAGPALIFCNSVAAVRRVGATLSTLGMPVRMLHAQMAQVRGLDVLALLRSQSCRAARPMGTWPFSLCSEDEIYDQPDTWTVPKCHCQREGFVNNL